MSRLREHDLLVVTCLNRLGRTTAEVLDTVKQLEWRRWSMLEAFLARIDSE
jgi:DNA invertase Pin-like site-specific DNA recombinase